MTTKMPRVLIVEDDFHFALRVSRCFRMIGAEVSIAKDAGEMQRLLARLDGVNLILLDARGLPLGDFAPVQDGDEQFPGVMVASFLLRSPQCPRIIGMSWFADDETYDWFKRKTAGFVNKASLDPSNEQLLMRLLHPERGMESASCFIVHGHDELCLKELRTLLRDDFGIQEIIVLREQPEEGRTIIEKFEDAAHRADFVFVLLTPDDCVVDKSDPENSSRRTYRARQNVILELGFFYGKLQRRSGRVIALHKRGVELPSDFQGVVYLDVSNGVATVRERIEKELKQLGFKRESVPKHVQA